MFLLASARATRIILPADTVLALVPAHDEESGIAETIESRLGRARRSPPQSFADNCSDDTVGVSRRSGCKVIESVGNTNQKAGALN